MTPLYSSDLGRRRRARTSRIFPVTLLVFLGGGGPQLAAAPEPSAIVVGSPGAAQSQLQRQRLSQLIQVKLRASSPAAVEAVAQKFIDHLQESSPLAAEEFTAGKMEDDDLSARVDVFLGDHPELAGRPAAAPVGSPRERVAAFLKQESGLATTDAERLTLADRFIQRLGELSGTAHDSLVGGTMLDEELQSRVTVFAADIRAERAVVAVDPSRAAVPALVDAYLKANYGPAPDRPDAICYRGTIDTGGVPREFVIFKKRPQKVRVHLMADGLVVAIIGFDGTTAWTQARGKPPVVLKGLQASEVADTARFDDPLIGYQERGADARLEDKPGSSPLRLHIREASGEEDVEVIDPATQSLLSQRSRRAGGKWEEIKFSDYRKVGGLNFAYTQETWADGVRRYTSRITQVNLEPGLLDSFFTPPAGPGTASFDFMDYMSALSILQTRAAAQPAAHAAASAKP